MWKTPSQTHKPVCGGWGFRVELHCVGSQNAEFFVVGKANRPLTCMTYRHGGRDRFGLAEGRGQDTEYIPSHSLNTTTAFGMEHFEPAQQNSIS